ncbi:DUF6551 family protein [Nocardia testacea]|uniref:DUF6551 family protein n=1 Tax=Nocardia testacea TaxID=248551 RepID=UPI00341029ED
MPTNGSAVLDRPTTPADHLPAPEPEKAVFIDAIPVDQIFADTTYQRDLDMPRVKRMAKDWDRRLVGVIDVSDRGPANAAGRYAVINGQHRWAAAGLRDPHAVIVANIHTGLTPADEARLFHEIDVKTRRLTTWDRWKSRRAAADPIVTAIEAAADEAGFTVDQAPADGNLRCVSTCEKVHRMGGKALLANTLQLIVSVWGHRIDAVDAPLVTGVALILRFYETEIDHERLADVLIDIAPRQLKARAMALKETESGQNGTLAALVMIGAYNSSRGPKLDRSKLHR